jgi:hypothetical protein
MQHLARPTSVSTNGRGRVACALVALLVSCVAAFAAHRSYVAPGPPLGWDEATHAVLGALIAEDVRGGDAAALLYDSYRQTTWSPLHSWLVGASFLIAGPSRESARASSLVALVLLGAATYWAGCQLAGRRPAIVGALAAGLTVTTPALVAFAGQCMTELPALAALGGALVAHHRVAARPESPERQVVFALTCLLTYFFRPHYGILLLLAALADLLITDWRTPARAVWRWRYWLATLALGLAPWFLYPPRWAATWRVLTTPSPHPIGVLTVPALLFYPRAFVALLGWPLAATILGLAIAGRRTLWRRPELRFMALLVGIQMLAAELHANKQARYLLPMVPAVLLLAAVLVAAVGDERSGARRQWRPWLLSALGLLGLARATELVRLQPALAVPHDEVAARVAPFLRATEPAILLVLTPFARPEPPELDWQLIAAHGVVPASRAGTLGEANRGAEARAYLRRLPLGAALHDRLRHVTERSLATDRNRSLHLGHPPVPAAAAAAQFLLDPIRLAEYRGVAVLPLEHREAPTLATFLERTGFTLETRLQLDRDLGIGFYRPSRPRPTAP